MQVIVSRDNVHSLCCIRGHPPKTLRSVRRYATKRGKEKVSPLGFVFFFLEPHNGAEVVVRVKSRFAAADKKQYLN